MSNGQLLLFRLLLCAAISTLMTWIGWKLGEKAWALTFFLFSTPIMAVALRKPLVEFIHEGFTWLSQQPMMKWQGVYYSFNDIQVRVYESGDDLWFVASDVLKAVGMPGVPDSFLAIYPEGCKVVPGTNLTAMNSKALDRMLGKRNEHEAIRFLLWMHREVIRPWERKREKA